MIVVNLFGAPASGKSTLALLVAGLLKTEHPYITTECPDEIPKLVVYDESRKALSCQIYILGRQYWQIARCVGHVDVVVCDSPVLLSSAYASEHGQKLPAEEFHRICEYYHSLHPSLNYIVKRNHDFERKARVHSPEDAERIDRRIRNVLDMSGVGYSEVYSTQADAKAIVRDVARQYRTLTEKNDRHY